MLSKRDIANALPVMRRFDRFIETDDIAVESWHELLKTEIGDAQLLREAVLQAYRTVTVTVRPAHIIFAANEIVARRREDEEMRETYGALDRAPIVPEEQIERPKPSWDVPEGEEWMGLP